MSPRLITVTCLLVLALQSDSVVARADAENLPFASDSFEVIICNHVYEHTDDASRLMSETTSKASTAVTKPSLLTSNRFQGFCQLP